MIKIVVTTFAKRLAIALAALDVGANELDRRLAVQRAAKKVNKGHTSKILSGQKPSLEMAEAMAMAIGVRPSWLLLGEGEMLPGAETPRYADLPGWHIAAAGALRSLPRTLPHYAINAAAWRPVLVHPKAVTPDLVIALAKFWFEFATDAEVEAAERADIEASTKH